MEMKELEKIAMEKAQESKAKWLGKYGFNKAETTFIYFLNDSYDRKEELKEAGFRFCKPLMWHCPSAPEGYEEQVIEVSFAELGEFSAWGVGQFYGNADEKVQQMMRDARPVVESDWFGEEKERIRDVEMTITGIRHITTYYGSSTIVKFNYDGMIAKWFTSTIIDFEPGDKVLVTATIKSHIEDEYEDNAKVTMITRAKLTEI